MKKKKAIFIMYEGRDEIIVTTPALEKKTLTEYFRGTGRNIDEYDRKPCFDAVSIESSVRVFG